MNAEAIDKKSAVVWQLARDGFEIVEDVLPVEQSDVLARELSDLQESQKSSGKSRRGGIRNLLRENTFVAEFASLPKTLESLKRRAQKNFFPVRALFFDKTPEANWLVPWHQDLTIAVEEKIETIGFSAWSLKEGITHVQPPTEILESMVTLRVHLDDCRKANGALKIIPKSHLNGRMTVEDITRLSGDVVTCEVMKGSALLMRPLLLHASSTVVEPSHRRVLHIEYASTSLPNGLEWFDR